jgi:hypothetical protein
VKNLLVLALCQLFVSTTETVIEDNPVIYADVANNIDQPGRVLVDGKAVYTFTSVSECEEPLPPVEPEDPENFAQPPPIDPNFDEFSPEGPGPGPPGATTVDKP